MSWLWVNKIKLGWVVLSFVYVSLKLNSRQCDLRFLLRCCAVSNAVLSFTSMTMPCCIDLGNQTASENIFLSAVAQSSKQVSAFLLGTFFSDHIFSDKAVALLHRFGKSDCFRKSFFVGCCAVSKAGLSFSAWTFFFGPYFFWQSSCPVA